MAASEAAEPTAGATTADSSGSAAEPFLKRETIATFFANGIAMMRSDETRQRCRDPKLRRPGQLLIELQRAEWDPLGVDQDAGCKALDQLEVLFPGDTELVESRNEFCLTAQRTFLQALEDRKPEHLERSAKLPRELIIEFFDACNTKMQLPETRELLLKNMTETKKIPNQLIIDMQRDMLENLGYERDHACAMLSNVGTDFPDDKELHQRFQNWQMCAQQACHQTVALYRKSGGEMPSAHFVPNYAQNETFQRLWKQANEEVAAMSPKERGDLLMDKQKKVEIFMQLPPEARQKHMERLEDKEKVEFMKVQVLAISMMKQQWQHMGHTPGCPNHAHHDGQSGHPAPAAQQASQTPQAPPQQQMM